MKDTTQYKTLKSLSLADGTAIVVLNMLTVPSSVPDQDVEQNIVRLAPGGKILWQISAPPPVYSRSAFTGIGYERDGALVAYRWDGTSFKVDVGTGVATLLGLTK